jgi:hypothetical protein
MELHKKRAQSLRTERKLKKALTAGGAGGLFSGRRWADKSSDELTTLSKAAEVLNYATSLNPASTILARAFGIVEMVLWTMVRKHSYSRS